MTSDWPSIYQAQRPFDPYVIPLPIRMGRPEKGKVPPPAIANLELMKVSCLFVCTIGGHHCALSFFLRVC